MENYKQRLTEQREALEKDLKELTVLIEEKEVQLDELKDQQSKGFKELRYLTKKLEKLKI